jgi:hypothetical protein
MAVSFDSKLFMKSSLMSFPRLTVQCYSNVLRQFVQFERNKLVRLKLLKISIQIYQCNESVMVGRMTTVGIMHP